MLRLFLETFLFLSSCQLKFGSQEINGLCHDRLKDEFTRADITDKMFKVQ